MTAHGLTRAGRVPAPDGLQDPVVGAQRARRASRLAELTGPNPAPLRKAATLYQAAIEDLTQRAGITA